MTTIRLTEDVPVQEKHGMKRGLQLAVVTTNTRGWLVTSPKSGATVLVLYREAEVVEE